MKNIAKTSLYFLIIGAFLLLGGIAFQMLIGISTMLTSDATMEQFGYTLLLRQLNIVMLHN
jgi:hypothetical protein